MQVTLQVCGGPRDEGLRGQGARYTSVGFLLLRWSRQIGVVGLRNGMFQSLPLLPALLQTALLALLAASVPLSTTYTSTVLAVQPFQQSHRSTPSSETAATRLISDPSPQQLRSATSVHVLTFASANDGGLLLAESEGDFDMSVWEEVYHEAERICRGEAGGVGDGNWDGEDVSMGDDTDEKGADGKGKSLEGALRDVVREKVERDVRWRWGVEQQG